MLIHNNEYSKRYRELSKKKVKWDYDYVLATFYDDERKKTQTIILSEFFSLYTTKPKPKISKLRILSVRENVHCLLQHYNIIIKFNVIKDSIELFINNVMSKLSFSNHIVDIQDIALKHGLKISKEKLTDLLIRISLDNKYNPIELYLKECKKKYDLNPNKNIFSDLCKTIKSTNNEYKVKFIGKFLLQMVWLACSKDDDQVSGQYMLVLQGKQGIGKTTWFSKLLPQKFRNEYFLGGRVLDPSNKDHIIETISNWLIEMGEITTTFKKTDQENLKNFITTNVDKVRPPFQKEAIRKKRRAVLCGTTNDSEYLRDFTGSRRFLTLECISIDKDHNVDIDQLWGYIYNLYLKGATYAFTYKEEEKIIEYNREYLSKPESLIFLEEKFILNPTEDKYDCWMTAEDIFNALGKQDIFFSKYKLARELKKYNVSSKRTHRTVFYNVKKM